jgi:hypothetical protein
MNLGAGDECRYPASQNNQQTAPLPRKNASESRYRHPTRYFSNKEQHEVVEEQMPREPLTNRNSLKELGEVYRKYARKVAAKKRNPLHEEMQLQRDMRGMSEVFDDCAVLADELEVERGMIFPIEITA